MSLLIMPQSPQGQAPMNHELNVLHLNWVEPKPFLKLCHQKKAPHFFPAPHHRVTHPHNLNKIIWIVLYVHPFLFSLPSAKAEGRDNRPISNQQQKSKISKNPFQYSIQTLFRSHNSDHPYPKVVIFIGNLVQNLIFLT